MQIYFIKLIYKLFGKKNKFKKFKEHNLSCTVKTKKCNNIALV